MKWLIIQSDGEHKGQDGWDRNDMLRECFAIRHALLCNGDQADIWGKGHDNYATPPNFYDYDGILTIENYGLEWLPDISGCWNALRFYWLIDAHWQRINTFDNIIPKYDIVLHSTRRYIPMYMERFPKQKHVYFPNGVDDRYFNRDLWPKHDRHTDLIFIGGKAQPRAAAIDQMVQECHMSYGYGITGQSYIDAILKAKMQFNKGLHGDINYRNWETIGLGACLLTEFDPEMELLGFKHDVNCLFYQSIGEAVGLAKGYLRCDEWKRIAEAGYQLSLEHSYTKRLRKALPTLA